ncbi:MAG: hypothetical protein PHH54_01960 [Candidatus Nanoarchaeia archaeon]|nr:hypothetical protein [Candidatus Nanoarchaeia archaeon]MDD5740727.1 hypothetical protein [Candidatus Nanoarchaeia archaeon]
MELKIHGQTLVYIGGECGIYKQDTPLSMDYAQMDQELIVRVINSMPKEKAIEAVTKLRDQAVEQAKWESTPQNLGFPILRRSLGPTPINEVRANIENTVKFSEDVLKVLKGK